MASCLCKWGKEGGTSFSPTLVTLDVFFLRACKPDSTTYDDQKVPFVFCSHKSLCPNETIPFSQCSGRKTEREAGMRLERRERRKEWDKGPQSESRLSSVTSGNGILEDGEVRSWKKKKILLLNHLQVCLFVGKMDMRMNSKESDS